MSLDTLLEAAKFIEMEEQKKRKATTQPPPPPPPHTRTMPTKPMPPTLMLRPPPLPLYQQQQQQQPPPPAQALLHGSSIGGGGSSVSAPAQLQLIAAATVEQQQQQQVTSSTMDVAGVQPIHVQPVIIHNSFDILNPVLLDESGKPNRKPPPMAFRSGMREVHNKLEKHRRAHLKECFDDLKNQLPVTQEVKKTSNLNILHSAIETIQLLQQKEQDHEHELERLAKEKIALKQRLANLKKDCSLHDVEFTSVQQDAGECLPTINVNEDMVTEAHITSDVQITKSITLPVNAAAAVSSSTAPLLPQLNGSRGANPAHVQTALSVVPLSYKMNQSVVVQKVFVPKSVMVSNQPMTHFIPMTQPIGGKVMPLMNAQYVVVTTPSRPS